LGPEKSVRLKKGPDKSEFPSWIVDESNWPLLTGGRFSELVVKACLTVFSKIFSFSQDQQV
jgi:hypothetical protein